MKLLTVALCLAIGVSANPLPTGATENREIKNLQAQTLSHNDFSCQSEAHPNPVVLLHGLGATFYEDLNFFEDYLKLKGFCTFSTTYGSYDGFPFVGGLDHIDASSQFIADFVNEVQQKTGATKVDLVGHSEGAFQSLYTPKFHGIAPIVDNIVAIAPPTHGTDFAGLVKLAYLLGNVTRDLVSTILNTFGCHACDELTTAGKAIVKLNDGKSIVQPGNKVTIIASKYDELVTPTSTSFIDESGVNNIYVQDYCPFDPVGHIGEAYDLNVWNLAVNALENKPGRKFVCLLGSPGK